MGDHLSKTTQLIAGLAGLDHRPWLLVLHPALLIQQWEEKSNLFLKDKEANR